MASSPRKPPASGPVAPVTASSLREGQLGTGLKVKLPLAELQGSSLAALVLPRSLQVRFLT